MNQEKNTLAYLIALVLKLDYKEVYDSLIFVNNKLDRQKYKDSGKTVDFVCRLGGKIIGIEMNNNSSKESLERNISYAADLFKSKMESEHKYEYELVIQININNFTFEGNNKIMEEYSLRNEEENLKDITKCDKIMEDYVK
ncbi:MAG: PD-(D/E)XK nuclease family transposase [Bacilli bacterium]